MSGARILRLNGMHGLGDNFHQRAIIRSYVASGMWDEILLGTSWVSVYWDLIERFGLKVVYKPTELRTQTKNSFRERNNFYSGPLADHSTSPVATDVTHKDVWFRAQHIREEGSVLKAMYRTLRLPFGANDGDFRIPVKTSWFHSIAHIVAKAEGRPIAVYRPLVERKEWDGCAARNPDKSTYRQLWAQVQAQNDYYVVSVADLVQDVEWIADSVLTPKADLELHEGQLNTEQLMALFAMADLVYCSPGFAVLMAQAVETPVICVFGGYESSRSFSSGARFSPYLGIDPIKPCECFQHYHGCNKTIDMDLARLKIEAFLYATADRTAVSA